MSKIDDALIKSLVLRYQKTGEGFNDILLILSEYVYNYPRIHSQYEDACGDFYIYVWKRLSTAIMKYKIQDCQFLTWLTVVLYRHYLNWLKATKKKPEAGVVYLDKMIISDIYSGDKVSGNNSTNIFQKDIIASMLDSLPKKVRIVMKLHFFDFFAGEDIKEAGEIFKQDEFVLFSKYKDILEDVVDQYEKRNVLWDKVNSSYHSLKSLKDKLVKIEDEPYNDSYAREELLSKVKKYKERHDKNIKAYSEFYTTVKNEVIGDFLGLSLNAVHNLVYRGKKLIRNKLSIYY